MNTGVTAVSLPWDRATEPLMAGRVGQDSSYVPTVSEIKLFPLLKFQKLI